MRALLRARRERREAAAEEHRRSALAIVDEVAGGAVAAGRATREVRAAGNVYEIELRPANARACPVTIEVDERMITLYLGVSGHVHEIWQKRSDERLQRLRACIEAVVYGRYRESIRDGRFGRKLVLTHETPDGPIEYVHYSRSDAEAATYEPY